MRVKRTTTIKVSRERLYNIIMNTEPDLTMDIVSRYTDSELREWMKILGIKGKLV